MDVHVNYDEIKKKKINEFLLNIFVSKNLFIKNCIKSGPSALYINFQDNSNVVLIFSTKIYIFFIKYKFGKHLLIFWEKNYEQKAKNLSDEFIC